MRLTLLCLFLLVSCSKVYDLEKKNGVYYLPDLSLKLSNPRDIPWEVGRKREVTISKGVRLSSSIPRISQKAQRTLYKLNGTDSWLIRLSRKARGTLFALEHFYINLNNITRNTKDFTVNLYYHAAAVSKRFRLFHCPAFNHRYKVASLSLENRNEAIPSELFVRAVDKFRGRATRLRFAPMVISGGRNLKGIYQIDMALYNSKTKMRYSNWFPVQNYLAISGDRNVSVPSCLGIKEENTPLPESKMPSIKDLEIK